MAEKSVFPVGPGYIGRRVLDQLQAAGGYHTTTLVRRKSAAADFAREDIKSILGDLSNTDLITKQAAASHIIIHTATADDLVSVEAILEGVRQRASRGQPTIYIHTSGCSLLSDDSNSSSPRVLQACDSLFNNTRERHAFLRARLCFSLL